jgi:4-hydroxy-4-methyl-2-oxoglutarate aldolase
VNVTSKDGSGPHLAGRGAAVSKPTVFRNIQRPDPDVTRVLCKLGTATVHEAQARSGLTRPYLRPIYPNSKIAGPAVTVSCQAGDNLMIHAAIEVCAPGDVMVVTTTSESTDGMFGDLLGVLCQARGVVGLIIDAGVRDTIELSAMQFPVWAKAISAQGTVKASAGSVNIPVVCAGTIVNPGDVIVADSDGVVVVPLLRAAEVARLGQQRVDKEEIARDRFRKGELSVDFFGLRAKLEELGVEYCSDVLDSTGS